VFHFTGENKKICEPWHQNRVVVVPSQEIAQVVWKLVHWLSPTKTFVVGRKITS
jgi:hypothetical protein